MTDQEIADKVRAATLDLNTALSVAESAGLKIDIDVDRFDMRSPGNPIGEKIVVTASVSRPL